MKNFTQIQFNYKLYELFKAAIHEQKLIKKFKLKYKRNLIIFNVCE
jgi:hypothetical protein